MSIRKVFLSSTSRDLGPYRDAAAKAIEGLDGYHCVRMEEFGARDAEPRVFCEHAVGSCDLYVGLLGHLYGSIPDGSGKSQTELEYEAAVSTKKPRLVFVADKSIRVPPDLIEDDTRRQKQAAFRARVDKDRVRDTFTSPDQLRALVVQGIRNWEFAEKSEEERDAAKAYRIAKLDAIERASYARCALRWEAAGVPEDEAQRLAEDQSIGTFRSDSAAKTGAVLGVVGDAGAGKSLGAERLYQRALVMFRREADSAIPIYLEARALTGGLEAAVRAEAAGLGEVLARGALVVLDGLDEREPAIARAMLDELRAIVRSWPNTAAVVTTRPVRDLLREGEASPIDPLSEEEALQLVSRFAGRPVEFFPPKWPPSVREAARRPLFAVVLGKYMAANEAGLPNSVGEVIQDLVRRLLNRVSLDSDVMEPLLRKLAHMRIDRGEPVPAGDVGIPSHVDSLARSRLVVETSGRVDFTLQVIAEWFGAQALLQGDPPIESMIGDEARLDRWRYPLVVAVSFGDESASQLLPPVASQQPGFASSVVKLAEPQTRLYEGASVDVEDGAKIRSAMQNWVAGIGPVAGLIAPLRKDGSLGSLGVSVGVANLTSSWYVEHENLPEVFDLAPNIDLVRSQQHVRIRFGRSSGKPAWPWHWSLGDLTANLARIMQNRALPATDGPLYAEAVWQLALAVCGRGSLNQEPISVDQLEVEIKGLDDRTVILRSGSPQFSVGVVRRVIDDLGNRGQDTVAPPWPGCDLEYEKGWIWEPYSAERLLERTRAVYGAALQGYADLVDRWFPSFGPWLTTAATLPAILKGSLATTHGVGPFSGHPSMVWYLEPLPTDSISNVDIAFGELELSEIDFDAISKVYRGQRGQSPGGHMVAHDEVLDIFGAAPVTELVYRWLWNDLQALGWVEGILSHRSS